MIFDHKQTINIVNHLFIHFRFLTRILNNHIILLFHILIDTAILISTFLGFTIIITIYERKCSNSEPELLINGS